MVSIYGDPFQNKPEVTECTEKETVGALINRYLESTGKEKKTVEVYDLDTGRSWTEEVIEETYKAVVIANDEEVGLDYTVLPDDSVMVMLVPETVDEGTASVLQIVGSIMAAVGGIVAAAFPGVGTAIGIGLAAVGIGLQIWAQVSLRQRADESASTKQPKLDHENNLSISGASNQDITDNPFPLILGKHKIAPYIIGSPYCTTYTEDFVKATDGGQYVTALYMVGYAPLKLTDFKIDSTVLTYNRKFSPNVGADTVMHGQLHGYSQDSGFDTGDILRKWKNNDVTLEILQGGFSVSGEDRYGKVYPQVVEQLEVNANLIRIKDKLIEDGAQKIYKGASVPDGFMTNSVRFSRACPQRLEVEIDFPNGLYATRTKSSDVYYYQAPVRLAIQWRYVKNSNPSSDAEDPSGWNDFDYIELGNRNGVTGYKFPRRYTTNMKLFDYNSSLGKTAYADYKDMSAFFDDKWTRGGKVFCFSDYKEEGTRIDLDLPPVQSSDLQTGGYAYNIIKERWEVISDESEFQQILEQLEILGKAFLRLDAVYNAAIPAGTTGAYFVPIDMRGENFSTVSAGQFNATDFRDNVGGINEKRYVAVKEFTDAECRRIMGYENDPSGEPYADLNCVEVRVLRISPSYLDETGEKASDKFQNMTYQDLAKWTYLRTFSFDKEKYREAVDDYMSANGLSDPALIPQGSVSVKDYPLRPLSDEDYDKTCIVALTLRQDVAETAGQTLQRLSLIAQSLAPKYDEANNTWKPANVRQKMKWWTTTEFLQNGTKRKKIKYYGSEIEYKNAVTRYLTDPEFTEGKNARTGADGSDFVDQIKQELFNTRALVNNGGSDSSSSGITRYYLPESMERDFVTANSASMTVLSLVGSHLGKDAKGYDSLNMDSMTEFWKFCDKAKDGTVDSKTGKEIEFQFNCNGVVSQATKLETLFQRILFTGRASYRRDDENKYEIVIGRGGNYPVALINRQVSIAMSNTRGFENPVSGFHMKFVDETDDYGTNDIYVMADGEDYKKPTRDISDLQIPYVTNREQLWSLGRSNLGLALLQRESYQRTVGKIGYMLTYGDVVLIQDDTLLIGTDNGGRIRTLIQGDKYIYGFVSSEPFHYYGEETFAGSGQCKQGVTIIQPRKNGASRCVTLRLALPGVTRTVEELPQTGENRTSQMTKTLLKKDGSRTVGWSKVKDYDAENFVHTYSMKKGLTNVVLFAKPVSRFTHIADIPDYDQSEEAETAELYDITPKIDDVVAFGEMGKITSKAVISSIKHSEGEKFQLTLVPYMDEIYNMGGIMPEFDANLTQPGNDGGVKFSGALSQADINTAAANAVGQTLQKIDELTVLYALELSPEMQTIPVSGSGAFLSSKDPVIDVYFYEGGEDKSELASYTAFINDNESGEWNGRRLTVPLDECVDEETTVTIIAEYNGITKIKTAVLRKIDYGDQKYWYEMLFPEPYGAGTIHATPGTKSTPPKYFPETVTVEKKVTYIQDGDQLYRDTNYGTIEVEFYDRNGNRILGDKVIEVGGYEKVPVDEEFDENETYYRKFVPITIKLGSGNVLAITGDTAAVLYVPAET